MNRKNIFLILTILGFIAPYYYFLQIREFDLAGFFQQISASELLSGLAMDLLVAVIVFWFFMFTETRKLQMKNAWVYVLATLLVGLSFALPLFLYFRERKLQSIGGGTRRELVDPWNIL
jgi:uncharacterized membrane protein (UPF0136 family)